MSNKQDIKVMLDRLNKASNSALNSGSKKLNEGNQVLIGAGIKMTGGIDTCENLKVEGRFEATLNDAKVMDITEGGVFKGNATVDEAFIRGTFDGNLIVRDNLFVYSGGKVKGKIQYKNLISEVGAEVSGNLKKLSATNPIILAKVNQNKIPSVASMSEDKK